MNDGQTLWKKASQAETDWCSTILLSGYDKSHGVAGEEHQGLKAAARSQEEQGRPLSGCRENMALPTPQFWLSNLQNSEEIVSSHSVCGPRWLNDKESTCNAEAAGDAGSIPGWGRAPEGGHGNALQCSCLENPMDTEASWAVVHRVTKNWIRLK